MRYIVLLLTSCLWISPALAGQVESGGSQPHSIHGPHHISMLLADTHANGEGDNFTIGLDYEYRLSELLGVGAVLERAYGELDATTLLAVADVHFQNGLIVQAGPGLERRDSENVFVGRIGMLYEFELKNYTLSPQLHWDYHDGEANTIVAGIALGFSF